MEGSNKKSFSKVTSVNGVNQEIHLHTLDIKLAFFVLLKTSFVIENNFLKLNFRINYCMVAHDGPHLQEFVHSTHTILTISIDILVLLLKKRNRDSNVQKFSDSFNRY